MNKTILLLFVFFIAADSQSQSIKFARAKTGHYKTFMDVFQDWKPTEEFIKKNPQILTNGEFSFRELKNWNSHSYPAISFENTIPLNPPGQIFVLFNGDEMPDIDGSLNKDHPNGIDYIPLFNAETKYYWDLGSKIYSNEGTYNVHDKNDYHANADMYARLNLAYQNEVKEAMSKKGVNNPKILPLASFNLSKEEINPNDLIFDFSIDGIWTNIKGDKIANKEFDCGAFYKLVIRDCAGKILKTYGQTIFCNLLPAKGYYFTNWASECVIFGHTYASAITSLLDQYAADNVLKAQIIKRTTALKIQASTDNSFIKLFKLKAEANHYRECQLNVINGLNELNKEIISSGGSGVDISGIKMPTNSNPKIIPQTTYDVGASAAATAAGIASFVVNEVDKAKVRQMQRGAEEIKEKFYDFTDMEEKAVESYNKLVEVSKISDINEIGNPSYTSQTNTTKQTVNAISSNSDPANFWDDGTASNKTNGLKPSNQISNKTPNQSGSISANEVLKYAESITASYQATNSTAQPTQTSNTNFWDDNSSTSQSTNTSNTSSQPNAPLKTLSTSSDLQGSFNSAGDAVSQSTNNSINSIKSKEQASLQWTDKTVKGYSADVQAISAAKSSSKNLPKSAGCPEAENAFNMNAEMQKCKNGADQQSCIKFAEAKLIRLYLQYCPDAFTPAEKQQMQQLIQSTENVGRQLQGGGQMQLGR